MQSSIERVYIAPGTRVSYTYRHQLNRKSYVMRTKLGTVVRTVKHRKGTFYNQPEVVVQFDGNKTHTRIEMSRIERVADDA